MTKELQKRIASFYSAHCDERPVLLGLSGGPDSMALFHLLRLENISFHVAHVDHGWRSESAQEAIQLEKMCMLRKIPFYLKTLKQARGQKNLEEKGRQARFSFFEEMCCAHHLQGVFLAHHADDQAETLLKRLFEGATLLKLKGLQPKSSYGNLTLFRPFLAVTKKEILFWLNKNAFSFFTDVTNTDSSFLRSRLRQQILPSLAKEFGKEVAPSLCRIGDASAELNEFVHEFLLPYRAQVYRENGYKFLRFNEKPRTNFLWKAIVADFFEAESLVLSQSVLQAIIDHLKKENVHKSLRVKKRQVRINRNLLSVSEIDEF